MNTSEMRFDISGLGPKDQVIKKFPELAEHPEFVRSIPGLDSDKCLRFVILLIDRGLLHIKDFNMRVEEAVKLAGFKKEDGTYPEQVKRMLSFNHPIVNNMIAKYFMILNNYEYELWYSNFIFYHQLCMQIRSNPGTNNQIGEMKKKMELQQGADQVLNTLMKKEYGLFNDGNIKRIIVDGASRRQINFAEELAQENTVI